MRERSPGDGEWLKFTNGQNADSAPGPAVTVGSTVTWTYVLTNTGSRPLTDIIVTDDQGVAVSCPGTTLSVAASMTCTASGIAQAGQYVNIGDVAATLFTSEEGVADSDPSHYFGQTLSLIKRTNGVESTTPPGGPDRDPRIDGHLDVRGDESRTRIGDRSERD